MSASPSLIFDQKLTNHSDREEATKEENFDLSTDYEEEEDDEWETNADWENEEGEEVEDVKDESTAYLDFLNEEAQKFHSLQDEDEEDLEEESLLETPLDKVEPYGMFKAALLRKFAPEPLQLHGNANEKNQVCKRNNHNCMKISLRT